MSYPVHLPFIGNDLAIEIDDELMYSEKHGTAFASLHEAYSVLLEELDEVWDITRQKRKDRSKEDLRKEFIQIAAMAIKSIQSLDNFVGGSV